MDPNDWLEVIRREYLADFVAAGGAAVKVVVPADAAGRHDVRHRLRTSAEPLGYAFASVDAETTKIHLIDRLFFEVARQVDWDALARAYLAGSLVTMGYRLPQDVAAPVEAPEGLGDGALTITRLAAVNNLPEAAFLVDIKRALWNRLLGDHALAREFRLAMIRLCIAQLDPADEPTLTEAVKQWLRGELRLISALKRALIFQRIARHNARQMLFSLARWLALAGKCGLVVSLDVARYADASRPHERGPGLYYSTTACMDLYEVLRQLIDATDELEHCFVGIVAAPEFLTDERRGLRSYHALYMRIADEVRDRYRPNPRSSLVRLAVPAVPAVAAAVASSGGEGA